MFQFFFFLFIGIYLFGFLFMLPQLFVNYKLKSVAHLPWRAFMYKVRIQNKLATALIPPSPNSDLDEAKFCLKFVFGKLRQV